MILAIDVGTTSLKLGVYDESLQNLAKGEFAYSLDTPDPSTVRIDPDIWWKAFLTTIKKMDFLKNRIEIIVLSVNSPGFSVMDRDGNPLMPSFTHLDRRAYAQSKKILDIVGEKKLLEVTGNIPNPGASSAANILWIREHHPDIYKKVGMYGHTNTFFAKRLTGRFGVDPSNICMSNLFNTAACEGYDADIARELDIDLNVLPPVYRSFDRIGDLQKNVADETGLTQGIPVLMGANDATCAAVSADIVNPGDIMNVTGTTEMVVVCSDKPIASSRFNLKNHAVPDRWNAMYALNTGGIAIEWAYKQFFREMEPNDFYNRLIPEIIKENRKHIPGFVPFLTGDRYSLRFKTASFTKVTLSTTREDMLLGVIGGVAQKVKEYLKIMESHLRLNPVVNVTGGGADHLVEVKRRIMKGFEFRRVETGSLIGAVKLAKMYMEGV